MAENESFTNPRTHEGITMAVSQYEPGDDESWLHAIVAFTPPPSEFTPIPDKYSQAMFVLLQALIEEDLGVSTDWTYDVGTASKQIQIDRGGQIQELDALVVLAINPFEVDIRAKMIGLLERMERENDEI